MSSTPHRSTHSGHLTHSDGETNEDDVQVFDGAISLYQANKIDKKNAWNVGIIDVLDRMVRNHHDRIRNFQNVGMSLDATMKVYGTRVDLVSKDVHRLYRSFAGPSARAEPNSDYERNDVETNDDGGEHENGMRKRPRSNRKARGTRTNIVGKNQLNGPLSTVTLPDDLSYKLNKISGDAADANRLFTTNLATTNSTLLLSSNDKFFDNKEYEPLEFRDDCMYEIEEFAVVPVNESFGKPLPLRQTLSGYVIRDTPMDVDEPEESFDEDEDDVPQDYAFDLDQDPDPFDLAVAEQEPNNNANNNVDNALDADDNIENVDELDVNNITKGEYSYRALSNIRNYWAGPSYWKGSLNRQSSLNGQTAMQVKRSRRPTKIIEKPLFDDGSSGDEAFISFTSRASNKIRNANYRMWYPERLKLPQKFDIPQDLFDFYRFQPAFNTFQPRPSLDPVVEENENGGDDGFYPIEFAAEDNDEIMFNLGEINEVAADISQEFPNAPERVENIQIAFNKRAKVVNMVRLNRQTLVSIDRQLVRSAEANKIAQNEVTQEQIEPGVATFSGVYRDARKNYRKFVQSKEDLSPGLVFFSILNAANQERLSVSKRPREDNDFDIVQLKKKPRTA